MGFGLSKVRVDLFVQLFQTLHFGVVVAAEQDFHVGLEDSAKAERQPDPEEIDVKRKLLVVDCLLMKNDIYDFRNPAVDETFDLLEVFRELVGDDLLRIGYLEVG